MLQTEQLSKRYDNGFMAVDRLSIHVHTGDIYGFLGPNGAGKTTTIRMIAGLIQPSSGSVTVAGLEVGKHAAEVRSMLGVLPESHGYYGWMTGRQYLTFFASMYGLDSRLARRRTEHLLERVGLADKRNVPIRQFSRGMKQRLGIAKSVVHEPQLVILDEPTLGLDPQGQRDIQQLIRQLNTEMNMTVVITSHLLKEIDEICNRVAIVKHGRLLEEDLVAGLKNKYGDGKRQHSLEDIFLSLTARGGR